MNFFEKVRNSQSGLTLVELMISTALFGISAFTMAILLAENSKRTIMAQNEAKLSESLLEFSNTMDVLIANTTSAKVIDCNCGTPNCTYIDTSATPAPDCSLGGCGTTTRECALAPGTCPAAPALFSLEIEDSLVPNQPRTNECLPSPTPASVNGSLIPRGCKKKISVYLSQPTEIATTGTLSVVPLPPVISIADVTNPARVKVISSIEGVISAQCGQTPIDKDALPVLPANRQFNYKLTVKARRSKQNRSTDINQLEGWHPNDSSFFMGPRREISSTIAFRNLNTYGVHFGKTLSDVTCHPDGGISQFEPEANCCSGYWVETPSGAGTASTCLSVAQCVQRGRDPRSPGALGIPATAVLPSLACCSHRLNPLGDKCL